MWLEVTPYLRQCGPPGIRGTFSPPRVPAASARWIRACGDPCRRRVGGASVSGGSLPPAASAASAVRRVDRENSVEPSQGNDYALGVGQRPSGEPGAGPSGHKGDPPMRQDPDDADHLGRGGCPGESQRRAGSVGLEARRRQTSPFPPAHGTHPTRPHDAGGAHRLLRVRLFMPRRLDPACRPLRVRCLGHPGERWARWDDSTARGWTTRCNGFEPHSGGAQGQQFLLEEGSQNPAKWPRPREMRRALAPGWGRFHQPAWRHSRSERARHRPGQTPPAPGPIS